MKISPWPGDIVYLRSPAERFDFTDGTTRHTWIVSIDTQRTIGPYFIVSVDDTYISTVSDTCHLVFFRKSQVKKVERL